MKLIKLSAVVLTSLIIIISCQKELHFEAVDIGISSGTLKSNLTGDCLPATVVGIFKVDSVLTSSNYVDVQVNVSIAGTFEIKSDTVNGYSFSKTGNVVVGLNTIRLIASGKPAAAGTNNFTIKYGTSICNFDVVVIVGIVTPIPNLDYIPQTSFSNWSSRLKSGTPADTTYVQVSPNSKTINSIVYKIFEVKDLGNPTDSIFQRKNGGMYYQLYDGDYGIFDNPFNKDGLILDSSLAVNATWTITLGTNTVGGLPVNVKINCQILEKNAAKTVAGNNYTQIIRVKYSYIGTLPVIGDVLFAEEERWYAKGFGLIYDKLNDVPVTTTTELETTRIQVF